MSSDLWTELIKRIDLLIKELKQSRLEANKWRSKAAELERLHLGDDRQTQLEGQSKDRELERLRKERKKFKSTVTRLIEELNQAEKRITEKANHE